MYPKPLLEAAETIHGRICEDSWDECQEDNGDCMKAATELYQLGQLDKHPAHRHLPISKMTFTIDENPVTNKWEVNLWTTVFGEPLPRTILASFDNPGDASDYLHQNFYNRKDKNQ